MKRLSIPLLTIFLLPGAVAATAAPIFTNSRATVAGTDYVDWGVLGPNGTVVSSPFSVASQGGLNVQVSKTAGSSFLRTDQGAWPVGWNGNFPAGSRLLYTNNAGSTATDRVTLLDFGGLGIVAGGASIQADSFGAFVAEIELFSGGASLGVFSQSGVSTGAGGGGALAFLGFHDSPVPVEQIAFRLTSAYGGAIGAYAIDRFDFTPAEAGPPDPPPPPPLAHTPEPLSMLLWAIVAAAALFARRVSRTGPL